MNRTHTQPIAPTQPRGSIYLVTLITVAAIVTVVLIGVNLRSSNNTQSAFIAEMAKSNNAVFDAAELAIQRIADDPAWVATAQSGVIFKDLAIADETYTATVTDAVTDALPDDTTTDYRVKLTSQAELARSVAQLEINAAKYDYLTHLSKITAMFYWPLNDAEKATRADELLRSHQGSYKSISTPSSGTNDQGAPVPTFANANDHIEIPWNNTFKQTHGSIAMWIKYTGPSNSSTISPFAGMRYESGGNPNINLAVLYNALVAYIDDNGYIDYGHLLYTSVGSIKPGEWQHIAMTWGSAGLVLYIDGTQLAYNKSNTEGVDTDYPWSGGEQPLLIGAGYNIFTSGTPQKGFTGSVSHVAYFDNYLSAAEVAELAAIKPDEITVSVVDGTWHMITGE